jgi:hypothetical protein
MTHIYPLNDWIEHKLKGTGCVCEPRIEIEGGELIVIHSAADGRKEHPYQQILKQCFESEK